MADGEINKVVKYTFVSDVNTALQHAKAYDDAVQKLKADLQGLTDQGVTLRAAQDALTNSTGASEVNTRALSDAVKEVKTETIAAGESIFDFGNVAQRVFRSIIGFIVLNVLRRLLDLYGELVEEGRKFANSILSIEFAVRKLQRAGEELTLQDVRDTIAKLREDFGLFEERELNDVVATMLQLKSKTQLSTSQLLALADATASLAATAPGLVDVSTAAESIARAITTGQTRGLSDISAAFDSAEVSAEAYRLGLARVGEEISKSAKEQAIYSLILQEAASRRDDATSKQKTEIGQYETETATVTKLKAVLGEQLLPAKTALLAATGRVLEGLIGLVGFIQLKAQKAFADLAATVYVVAEAFKILTGQSSQSLKDLANSFDEIRAAALRGLQPFELGDYEGEVKKAADGVDEGSIELDKALNDLFNKIRENIIDGNQQIEKAFRQLADKLQDIERKLAQRILELTQKLAFDRAKIWRDYNDKVGDINRKYRDKELDAERKYQDRLKSLRAKFLLDLEEALQERDARQIIRLIKRFKLQQDELKRQRESERNELKDQRDQELRDLQLQRERRLRELDLEFQFRQQKLIQQAKFEADQAAIDNERKIREIQIATKQRNEELVRRYADEHAITDAFAKAIRARLNATFGPGGQIEQIYKYFLEMTSKTFESLNESLKKLNRIPGQLRKATPQGTSSPSYGGNYAEGGTLVANKPTLALFGEGGPERIDFTPLTRPGANIGKVFGGTLPASLMEQKLLSIMISLSPGLEAEIINKSLGELADVIIDTNRQRL